MISNNFSHPIEEEKVVCINKSKSSFFSSTVDRFGINSYSIAKAQFSIVPGPGSYNVSIVSSFRKPVRK